VGSAATVADKTGTVRGKNVGSYMGLLLPTVKSETCLRDTGSPTMSIALTVISSILEDEADAAFNL